LGLIDETPVPITQSELEFQFVLELYNELQPKKILEVGSHHGGTLYHWIRNAPLGATVFAVDNQHINEELYEEWAGYNAEVKWAKGDSKDRDIIGQAKVYGPYDWVFIDGDHTLAGVLSDWLNYGPMVNRQRTSIVAFHDILPHEPYVGEDGTEWPVEVNLLWREIRKEYPTLEVISNPGNGIGVVYFPPRL
jgi:cephalosporin hydroxylase